MYALRLIGHTWYKSHDATSIGSANSLDNATIYETAEEAETAAMILTTAHADWMRKVRVCRVRVVTAKKIRCLNPNEKRPDRRIYRRYSYEHYVTC